MTHDDERLDQTLDDDHVEQACCECGSHAHTCQECPVFSDEKPEKEA